MANSVTAGYSPQSTTSAPVGSSRNPFTNVFGGNYQSSGGAIALSSSDEGLLQQFGIGANGAQIQAGNSDGSINQSATWDTIQSAVGNVDATLNQLNPLVGSVGFDQASYNSASANRTALNKLRLQDYLTNTADQSDPAIKQIETFLTSSDPSYQAAIAKIGLPDVTVLSDPKQAATWIQSVSTAIGDAKKASSDALSAQNTAGTQLTTAAQTGATQAAAFTAADNQYQAALQTAGNTFDATTAAQMAQRQSDSASLERGLGAGAVTTAAGVAEGLAGTQATADRAASMADANTAASKVLSDAYEAAIGNDVTGTSLNSQQLANLHGQAADTLVATIAQEYGMLNTQQQGQLGNVSNLIQQYQNSVTSAEQKQSLFGQIVQAVLGAGSLAVTAVALA